MTRREYDTMSDSVAVAYAIAIKTGNPADWTRYEAMEDMLEATLNTGAKYGRKRN